jgi:hypothetical protein
MPPAKYWDPLKVGDQVQKNYDLLTTLFDTVQGKQLRDKLFAYATEQELREELQRISVPLLDDVRVMLVDIENARTKTFDPAINPAVDKFYVLTLAPVPRRPTADAGAQDYKRMQAWEGAWHHAIVDGYGL